MNWIIALLPRLIVGTCGAAIGGLCAKFAWEGGMDFAGPFAAAGFTAIVVACWFIPQIIRTTTTGPAILGTGAVLIGTMFVLITATGNAAKHRSGHVGTAESTITAYTDAEAELVRLTDELALMRRDPKKPGEDHPRWRATAGCANATLPESTDYCRNVARVQSEMDRARAIIRQGRPLVADPQAASLRKLLSMTPASINEWMPIWTAIVCELLATACMTLAFAPIRREPEPIRPAPPQIEAPYDSAPAWISAHTMPKVPFGRVDGRKLRHLPRRAANENAA